MLIDTIRRSLGRDLDTLAAELTAYPDDASVWALPAGAPNSAGTLTLHLAGNLRHFIGATLGHTGYVRQRELEFSTRDVPRSELLALIATTRREVDTTLAGLDDAVLDAPYALPLPPTSPDHGKAVPTGRFLAPPRRAPWLPPRSGRFPSATLLLLATAPVSGRWDSPRSSDGVPRTGEHSPVPHRSRAVVSYRRHPLHCRPRAHQGRRRTARLDARGERRLLRGRQVRSRRHLFGSAPTRISPTW
ncbi:MAG: hypothetical protein V9G18_21875 [Albidovulum sp.]